MPFQNGDTVIFFGQRYGGTLAVRLHLGHSQAQQPRGLAGVGRQDLFPGRSPLYFPAASAFSASASSTAPAHGAFLPSRALQTSAALSPTPARPAKQRACPRTSGTARRRPAGGCPRWPPCGSRGAAFGVRESTSWITGSTLARYTSPAPPRKAPSVRAPPPRGRPCCPPRPAHCRSSPCSLRHAPGQQPAHQLPCDFALHLASLENRL